MLVHMALDSVVAPMTWLAPFSDAAVEFVRVPRDPSELDRQLAAALELSD